MRRLLAFSLALLLAAACGDDHGDHDDHGDGDHAEHADDGGGHEHEAPHGGTLVPLGEHFAHLEVKLDAETGRLDVWVLDEEADRTIRLEAAELRLAVDVPGGSVDVRLAAQPSELTGETVGDSARFAATVAELAGVERFEARLARVAVRGRTFEAVAFRYPEGNE